MATFQADLIRKRARLCTTRDSQNADYTATIKLAAGTQVTSGDVIQLADLAANHQIVQIRVYTDDLDDGTTLTSNWGFQQLAPGTGYGGTNASGVAQDFDVASGTYFASPSSNSTYFASAATVGRAKGWSTLTLANTGDTTGPGGPVRMCLAWSATPTQTTASASDRVIRVQFTVARATPVGSNSVDMGGY